MDLSLHWGVRPPADVQQGEVISPTPTVELRAGGLLAPLNGEVSMRLRSGRPLVGEVARPLVAGVATFPGLSMEAAGAEELVASLDTEQLVYPGMSSDSAVILFRFNESAGSPEAHAEVGDRSIVLSSGLAMTGRSIMKVVSDTSTAIIPDIAGVPGMVDAVASAGFVRLLYRAVQGSRIGPNVRISAESGVSMRFATNGAIRNSDSWRAEVGVTTSAYGANVPRGELHLMTASWVRAGGSTNVTIWVDGEVNLSSRNISAIPSRDLTDIWLMGSQVEDEPGQEIFEFGVFSGTTDDETERLQALRCGVLA